MRPYRKQKINLDTVPCGSAFVSAKTGTTPAENISRRFSFVALFGRIPTALGFEVSAADSCPALVAIFAEDAMRLPPMIFFSNAR